MNKIGRIFAGVLCAALCFPLTSCGGGAGTDDGPLTVVATNFALYDFARAVCGDACDVRMLLSPGSESHDFEATLEDIALLAETDEPFQPSSAADVLPSAERPAARSAMPSLKGVISRG